MEIQFWQLVQKKKITAERPMCIWMTSLWVTQSDTQEWIPRFCLLIDQINIQ